MNSESDDDSWPSSDSHEAPRSLAHAVSHDDDDDTDDIDDIDLSSDEENDTIALKQQQKQQLTSTAHTNIIANHSHQQQQHVISDESLSTPTTSDAHHHTKELTYEEKLDLIASQGKYLNSLVYLNRQRTVGMRSRTSRMVTTTTTTIADHEAQDSILSAILNDIYYNHPNNDKDDDDDYHRGMNHSNNAFNNKQKSNKQNNSTAQQQQQQSKFNKQFIFEDGFVRVEPLSSSSSLLVLSDNVELNRSPTIHDVHNANDCSYHHTLHNNNNNNNNNTNNNNNSDSFNRMIRDIITESSDDDDDDDSDHSSGHHYHHHGGSSNSNSSSNSSKHEYVNGNHRNDTNSINRKRQHVTSSLPTRNSKRDSIIGSLNRPLSISLDYNLQKLLEDKLFDELNARSTTLLPVIEKKKDDKSNIMYDEDQLRLLRTLCQRMCSVHERYYSHWGQSDLEVQDVSENILDCFFLDD